MQPVVAELIHKPARSNRAVVIVLAVVGGIATFVIVVVVVAVLLANAVIASGERRQRMETALTAEEQAVVAKARESRGDAQYLVQHLIDTRVLDSVEDASDGQVRAYVAPSWHSLSYHDKQANAAAIFVSRFDGSRRSDTVLLIDRNGRQIGSVTRYGLRMR